MRARLDASSILDAQRAALSGDEHVRREVAAWIDADPGERLAALAALCRDAVAWLSRLPADQLEEALAGDPLPADSLAILRAMRRR